MFSTRKPRFINRIVDRRDRFPADGSNHEPGKQELILMPVRLGLPAFLLSLLEVFSWIPGFQIKIQRKRKITPFGEDNICPMPPGLIRARKTVPVDRRATRCLAGSIRKRASPVC